MTTGTKRGAPAVRLACSVLAAGALASALSGCFPLALGGAAMTGMAVSDRRTTGTQVEDESIEFRARNAINTNFGDNASVSVTSYNRQVLLTGAVATQQDKERVEQYVSRVENVRAVVNDIGVMPQSSFSQRSNDTFITSKVKASLLDAKDISGTAIKVVTERGAVYLMGRVTQREAKRSAEIARGVSGVLKVVRVFEVISEEELAQIGRQQAPAPSVSSPAAAPAPAPAAVSAPAPITDAPPATVVTPVR
ncbi:BON domain-containing protein [Xylophilus sp. GW821-FHT01B05]